MQNRNIKGLYIHIPFCNNICIYCDFYKMISKEESKKEYINYLIKELELKKDLLRDNNNNNSNNSNNCNNIETIYIGGGTPSCLSLDDLKKLFSNLAKYLNLNKLSEFTIECNPNDITLPLINLFKEYHVNRISLGVQSFNNQKLKYLNRTHDKNIAINAIKLLKNNGFNNINCDFIYGLEIKDDFCDNIDLIKEDLDIAINLNVPHISFYSLIIENKTILNKFIKENKYQEMDDDKEADIYDFINEYLKKHHYIHYEVSNYALDNYMSKHNLIYWNNDYYLGLGVNASYYYNNTRYTNINNLKKYYQGIDNLEMIYSEKEQLTIDDVIYEEVMLGLRKLSGINKNNFFNRYNCDIIVKYPKIKKLIDNKILIDDGDNIFVSEDKIYILNDILLEILE